MQKLSRSNRSLADNDAYYYAPVFASAQAPHALVYSIDKLYCELNDNTSEYLVINATGITISAGWHTPCLIPRSYPNHKPMDGFWAFDFCCIPPHSKVIQHPVVISTTLHWHDFESVQADLQGIRVNTQTNNLSFSLPSMAQ